MADDFKGFTRMNFFTGLQASAEDMNALVQYDVEKQRLQNRLLHAPGVVPNVLGSLRVTARGRADLTVEVAAGYAVDAQGRELFLPEPVIKALDPSHFKLPQTVYLVLKYVEDLTDFVRYRSNPEHKGHRRVAEQVKLDAIITEPDIDSEVELARIHLTKDVKRITDAADLTAPRSDELDLRFVPIAGAVGCSISPAVMLELGEIITESRLVYAHMYHALRITTAGDVMHALLSLDMFTRVRLVDWRNIFDLFSLVLELQSALIHDVDTHFPQFSSKKEFASFKKHVELMQGLQEERTRTPEHLSSLMGYERKCTEQLSKLFSTKMRAKEKSAEAGVLEMTEALLEKIKIRSEDFTPELSLDGFALKRVDLIDVLNKRSEADHKFKITDARDKYRTRQKLKYPDGIIIEDVGIAFEGGTAEFEISNATPNKDVYLIARMDYVHGDWEAEVFVNGKKVTNWVCEGSDRKFRWRNWPLKIPAEFVTDTFLSFRVVPQTADRDVNMFMLWFYQPA